VNTSVSRLLQNLVDTKDPAKAATSLIRERCALLTARRRIPGKGGSSNLYTEEIHTGGNRYFVKAVKSGLDREIRFYSALLGGMVKAEGANYLIPTPIVITQTEQSTTYLFPYYSVRTLKRRVFFKKKGWRLLQGVAAFNANHPATPALRNLFEVAHFAPDLERRNLDKAFGMFPSEQVDALHNAIVDCCAQIQHLLQTTGTSSDSSHHASQLSLSMNDFNRKNAGFTEVAENSQALLMDMGRAQLAPLGHDLRWYFHYICQAGLEITKIKDIVDIYVTELARHELSVDPSSVELAGLAGCVDSWLRPSSLLPSERADRNKKWKGMKRKIAFLKAFLNQL